MPGFDPFAPGGFAAIALVASRVGGILLIAPMFASRAVPLRLRAALLVVLTLALLPLAGSAGRPPAFTAATLVSETLVGFTIGLGAAVFVAAAELAGDLIAVQTGLSGASTLDPMTPYRSTVLSQFAQFFAVLMLLSVNGHLLLLEALAYSAELIPIGSGLDFVHGLDGLVGLGSGLFTTGLRFAAPITGAVLVGNAALGILARTVPQLNILMVAFPLQIGIGLFTLAIALPVIGMFFADWPSLYEAVLTPILGAFSGGS